MTAAALVWVRWWHLGWLRADASWWPPALACLPTDRLQALARSQHAALGAAFALPKEPPPAPVEVMTALLAGPVEHRARCLELAAALCQPLRASALSPAQRDWCLSVARALRPGQWLTEEGDALELLRAWLPGAIWQRARLAFPRSRIERLEAQPLAALPTGRLQALWHAVHWQALHSVAVSMEIPPHADPTYA